jgi:hypothetical protein
MPLSLFSHLHTTSRLPRLMKPELPFFYTLYCSPGCEEQEYLCNLPCP